MKTMLFLDVENMGSKDVRKAVDKLVKEFSPAKKELVYSLAAKLPSSFKDTSGWSVHRCKPGKNAADKVLQKHILEATKDAEVDRIIVVTSDHGFLDVCRKVLLAGKALLLMVKQFGALAKRVLARSIGKDKISVLEVNQLKEIPAGGSIFMRRKNSDEIVEVPFQSGISVGEFVNILKENGLYRKHINHWIHEAYLEIIDSKVFIMPEERLVSAV